VADHLTICFIFVESEDIVRLDNGVDLDEAKSASLIDLLKTFSGGQGYGVCKSVDAATVGRTANWTLQSSILKANGWPITITLSLKYLSIFRTLLSVMACVCLVD